MKCYVCGEDVKVDGLALPDGTYEYFFGIYDSTGQLRLAIHNTIGKRNCVDPGLLTILANAKKPRRELVNRLAGVLERTATMLRKLT